MGRWCYVVLCLLLGMAVAGSAPAYSQEAQRERYGPTNLGSGVVVPDSSRERPQDIGARAHTNHLILARPNQGGATPSGLVPSEIRNAYGLPAYTGQTSGAGTDVIAIVDAYDYPTAEADFDAFAETFGLPRDPGDGSVFEVVYATGQQPRYNSGWSQEAALDIEWAHAMAPTAKIVLVEASSNSFAALLDAVSVAGDIPGVREISMSWGGGEFRGETSYDSAFTAAGVVYFAASGDSGGKVIWPGASPNVVCAGGTTLNLDSSGSFVSETGWSGSGGGKSKYEARPSYQDAIEALVGTRRGAPDISFDSDPNTGVSVYWQDGWYVFGGTSVATPSLAGIVNLAASANGDSFATDTFDELANGIYANLYDSSPSPTDGSGYVFRDITSGSAARYRCQQYWDFVTGVGSDWGLDGK
jgi:kumamolisin